MKCFQLIFPAACCVCLLSNLGQADDSPLIPRYENAQWSYVTLEGEQRIEQKFDRVTRFKHGVSLARDGEDFFAISRLRYCEGVSSSSIFFQHLFYFFRYP